MDNDINTIILDILTRISSILEAGIPLVLAIVAGLIGLSFMVRYIRKQLEFKLTGKGFTEKGEEYYIYRNKRGEKVESNNELI